MNKKGDVEMSTVIVIILIAIFIVAAIFIIAGWVGLIPGLWKFK